tara:strand:- start:196 stop:435 length:240 start_codon:yes stop_codon:yes gene_type:complete
MRDQIADILENMPENMNGWEDAADAILAALPKLQTAQARIAELRHALAELLYVQDGLPMTGIEATRRADQARAALKETP